MPSWRHSSKKLVSFVSIQLFEPRYYIFLIVIPRMFSLTIFFCITQKTTFAVLSPVTRCCIVNSSFWNEHIQQWDRASKQVIKQKCFLCEKNGNIHVLNGNIIMLWWREWVRERKINDQSTLKLYFTYPIKRTLFYCFSW